MVRMSKKLLPVPEAAERLGWKEATMRRKILERKIAYVKVGKSVRIPVEAIDLIIADGWREPVAK